MPYEDNTFDTVLLISFLRISECDTSQKTFSKGHVIQLKCIRRIAGVVNPTKQDIKGHTLFVQEGRIRELRRLLIPLFLQSKIQLLNYNPVRGKVKSVILCLLPDNRIYYCIQVKSWRYEYKPSL